MTYVLSRADNPSFNSCWCDFVGWIRDWSGGGLCSETFHLLDFVCPHLHYSAHLFAIQVSIHNEYCCESAIQSALIWNIFRDVMVANAQGVPGPEEKKIFDIGYLVAVFGFLLFFTALPFLQYATVGISFVSRCNGITEEEETGQSKIVFITIAFLFLFFFFTILIGVRTRKNLRKLNDDQLKNLPSNNALTYLDTELLSFLLFTYVFLQSFKYFLFVFDIISWELTLTLANWIQLVFNLLVLTLGFPVYIILKTRQAGPLSLVGDCRDFPLIGWILMLLSYAVKTQLTEFVL